MIVGWSSGTWCLLDAWIVSGAEAHCWNFRDTLELPVFVLTSAVICRFLSKMLKMTSFSSSPSDNHQEVPQDGRTRYQILC